MRLLLDINILLDIAFQRPGDPASSSVVASCGQQNEGWLAWHTLATLAYVIARQSSAAAARSFIGGLLGWAEVAMTTRANAVQALSWPMADYEDALQAAAAQACSAHWIITRNERDFAASPVPT